MSEQPTIYQRPAELLQHLIRFDTTNPPGNEAACIHYINDLLQAAGIETTVLALDENRPNVIARLKGRGDAPPLLLYGHVDVVTTLNQAWTHPPFAAEIHDGYIWGRGAVDMKGGVAMMLAAFLRARAESADLPGDVILALVSDEEALGTYGAGFLVEKHADLFTGVRYALGEFGGFTLYVAGKRFYPIMVTEKQCCWIKATVHGPGGHGSVPVRGGAMARLADMLKLLDINRLPVHVTPGTRYMLEGIAAELSFPINLLLRLLLIPPLTDTVLNLMGTKGRLFDPILHNTVSPTVLYGSAQTNVIPGAVSVELDGRMLPGFTPEAFIAEIRSIVGPNVEFEITSFDPGPPDPNMGLYPTLANILREADPGGIPIPLVLPAVTDGRLFARIGIQTYGFTPMQLRPEFEFSGSVHAADERIPVEAVAFGTDAIYQALLRFHA
jgi:acetylornithine deacetylase/succinyl-diaminopimelate desuccinylase-like protein